MSGTVTGPSGKAINGVQVTAFIYDGFGHRRPASSTVTASGGKYTVNGCRRVCTGRLRRPPDKYLGEYYDNKYSIDKA